MDEVRKMEIVAGVAVAVFLIVAALMLLFNH